MSRAQDAERDAALELLDGRLAELRAKIDAQLAALVEQGEDLLLLLAAERRARAEMTAHIARPARA
jgi:hypothetical protein